MRNFPKKLLVTRGWYTWKPKRFDKLVGSQSWITELGERVYYLLNFNLIK